MKRTILVLLVCIGFSGCNAAKQTAQTSHPTLLGDWVGTISGEPYVQESVKFSVFDMTANQGNAVAYFAYAQVNQNNLTPPMEACDIVADVSTAYTQNPPSLSMINWSSATNFSVTIPSSNPSSSDGLIGATTVNGVYNPNTPNTFTATITGEGVGTLSGQGPEATCNLTGNFTVTLVQ